MSKQNKQQPKAAKAANEIPPAVATEPVIPSPAAIPAATDLPVDTVVLPPADGERNAASEEVLGAAPNIDQAAPNNDPKPPVETSPLLPGGPTLSEYVAAGYDASTYPPKGYAPVPERVAAQQMDGRTDLFGNPSNYKPLFSQGVPPGSSII